MIQIQKDCKATTTGIFMEWAMPYGAIDKFIENEYAQKLLPRTVKALSKNPENKPFASDIRQSYQDITEDAACKEVYQ